MKRISYICILFLAMCSLAFAQSFDPSKDPKTKVIKDYEWPEPEKEEDGLLFRLITLTQPSGETSKLVQSGEKGFSYYIKVEGDKYAKITTKYGPSSLGTSYFLPNYKSTKLVFYKREIKEGEEVFTPVTEAEVGQSKNVIIAMFGDGTQNKVIAISPDSVPYGSYGVVNLSPTSVGLRIERKASKMAPFQFVVREPKKKSKSGVGYENVEIFDISKNPPRMYSSVTIDVAQNKRVIIYTFKPIFTINGPDPTNFRVEVHR